MGGKTRTKFLWGSQLILGQIWWGGGEGNPLVLYAGGGTPSYRAGQCVVATLRAVRTPVSAFIVWVIRSYLSRFEDLKRFKLCFLLSMGHAQLSRFEDFIKKFQIDKNIYYTLDTDVSCDRSDCPKTSNVVSGIEVQMYLRDERVSANYFRFYWCESSDENIFNKSDVSCFI